MKQEHTVCLQKGTDAGGAWSTVMEQKSGRKRGQLTAKSSAALWAGREP